MVVMVLYNPMTVKKYYCLMALILLIQDKVQTIGGYGAGEREVAKSGAELYVDSTTNSG